MTVTASAPCFSSSEPPLYARAIYDFNARNGRELSLSKGDVVQVTPGTAAARSKAGPQPFLVTVAFSTRW